ncbi:MrcB family domain-containing protein [Ruegeria lacuscaerulensis]|uniref:MrcB family domain-containing protein n=1 Tax=Ruegeria lacuscaerulensis TaxID=55218 RepID=UPI00147BB510|nr:DUF3578 domain-containing protein [Ruegeria lacuscaerulensis]
MLHEYLSRLARDYVFERSKNFSGSEFGNFVRHDIAIEAKKRLLFLPYEVEVKASVGQSRWAAVPWLAFFDPLITDTATRGFYVVYLINAQTEEIVLSLNQGTTEVYREFGENDKGRKILARRAVDLTERVPEFSEKFSADPLISVRAKIFQQDMLRGMRSEKSIRQMQLIPSNSMKILK